MQMMAVKSRLGHAETGAGVLGVFHACQHLCSLRSEAMTHLRSVNPHVEGLLSSSSAKIAVALPRLDGPAASTCTGISSFAFQVSCHDHHEHWAGCWQVTGFSSAASCIQALEDLRSFLHLSTGSVVLNSTCLWSLQGTNAHAVLTAEPPEAAARLTSPAAWRQHRYWHLPAAHAVLQAVSCCSSSSSITMQAMLSSVTLSHLSDFRVRAPWHHW